MDCHNTQRSTATAESARLRAWLFLAAARDVRERAKRTVWPIISEACNAACRTPSRTQHTGQRARGLRDWHWLQERCRANGGGGSLARRVARQEKHALHTHLEGLQAVLREEPVVRVDACAAQAAAVSSGRSSGQMRRGSWRSAHGGSRLRRYSQSAPSCSLILTVSEPPTTPIVTFLRSSFMNAVISGVTSCGARGAAVKTAAASPWLGKRACAQGRPAGARGGGGQRAAAGRGCCAAAHVARLRERPVDIEQREHLAAHPWRWAAGWRCASREQKRRAALLASGRGRTKSTACTDCTARRGGAILNSRWPR